MDINSLLPILLNNKNNEKEQANDSADKQSNSVDSIALMSSLLSGNVDQSTILNALASSSGNPQLAQTLSLANNLKSRQKRTNGVGFRPIKPFVSNDILGKLVKHFTT